MPIYLNALAFLLQAGEHSENGRAYLLAAFGVSAVTLAGMVHMQRISSAIRRHWRMAALLAIAAFLLFPAHGLAQAPPQELLHSGDS